MLKTAGVYILESLKLFISQRVIVWTDSGINFLSKKIKQAEKAIPASGQGRSKWELVWKWVLEECGEELAQHKDDIRALVGKIVGEFNSKKLW